MADEIEQDLPKVYCRTCLRENHDEKFEIAELPHSLFQLILRCIGTDFVQTMYPDSICKQCYDLIKSFHDFKNRIKTSNGILKDFYNSYIVNRNETLDRFLSRKLNISNYVDVTMTDEETTAEEVLSAVQGFAENKTGADSADISIHAEEKNTIKVLCPERCKSFTRYTALQPHFDPKTKQNDSDEENLSNLGQDNEDNEGDKSTLPVHKRLHRDKRSFECKICEQTFKKKIALKKHMEKVHPNIILKFECKHGCGKTFSYDSSLSRHHARCKNKIQQSGGDKKVKKKKPKSTKRN